MSFFFWLAPRRRRPISWTSTPDLDEKEKVEPVAEAVSAEISISLPRRRHTAVLPELPPPPQTTANATFTLALKPPRPASTKDSDDLTINRNDSLAERVRKMQLLKKQNSIEREIRSRQSSIEK